MSYTQIFGGTTIYPSDVSLLDVDLTADISLDWPLENAAADYPAARIIDVTATGAFAVSLPDATLTGAGQTILINNLSASTSNFTVKNFAGATIATIGVGEQWQLYLADTATSAGTWRVFRFGASTATVQPSDLAGYGITTTSNTLSQSMPVTTFNVSPRTLLGTERAAVMVWNGTGAGSLLLPAAAAAGNNFFASVRNSGGGALTVDPNGSEQIDGEANLLLQPGDSTTLVTDGLGWYSVGLGQQAIFAFDFTAIAVTGGTYTLAGSELNRIAYRFTGALTSDATVVVPPTVQQYWVDNATTGAYTLTLKTASGTGSVVTQGARGIYYCDGVNFVDADTSTVSLPVSAANGGTGLTSYTAGDLLYAASTTSFARLSDVAIGNVLLSGGVGLAPAWGKVELSVHVSGSLPTANGGTGAGSFTPNGILYGNGTGSLGVTAAGTTGQVLIGNTGTAPTWAALSSFGVTTFSGTTTGLTPSTPTSGAISLGGTLVVGNGGTGAATASDARTNLGVPSLTGTGASGSWGISVTGTSANVTGTVAVANGGTGATTAATARTNLGATTVGGNFFTLTNPDAVTFTRINADNTVSALDAASFRTAIGAGTSSTVGTVTSVGGTGTVNGITLSGTVTSSGNLTLGGTLSGVSLTTQVTGTLPVANGGTGQTSLTAGYVLKGNGASAIASGVIFDDGANVAIGTASPSAKLHVKPTTDVNFWVTNAAGVLRTVAINDAAAAYVDWRRDANTHTFETSGSERFRITSTGNVGVGTTAPAQKMHVVTTAAPTGTTQSFVRVTADVGYGADFGGGLIQGVGSIATISTVDVGVATERLRVDSAGNVGVGTSSPGSKLTVSGTVSFSGALTSGDLADAVGYKGLPQNAQTTGYTLALSDMGKHVSITTGGITIPANSSVAFPIGSSVVIYNDSASTQTIGITTDTLRWAGTTSTGTRTLAAYGIAALTKVGTTTWVASGNVS